MFRPKTHYPTKHQPTSYSPFRRRVERLEDKIAPAGVFAAGADAGGSPEVRVFDSQTGETLFAFNAYDPAFRGGVRVAIGDVSGDGVPDIVTAAGPGGAPHIKVFDGRDLTLLASFYAFDPTFSGGATIATGDVNNDGITDLIVGAGAGGGPQVRVFDIVHGVHQITGPLGNFFAFDASFHGGVNVAAGNIDGVAGDELIVAAGAGGGPHVKAFTADGTVVASFFAYSADFTGGVFVAAGDVNDDGHVDIITGAGAGGGPHVKVFSGLNGATLASFFAYTGSFTGGVRVASADLNDDDHAEIVTGAGPGGGPDQRVFDGLSLNNTDSVFAFDAGFTNGISVGSSQLSPDGDPAAFQLVQESNSLDRIARFVPNAIPSLSNWVSEGTNDASLDGKHVYVIAHGWAPGFKDMVQAYLDNNLPNPPLKWWQTLDTMLPDSPGGPSSPEMFYGSSGDGVQISPSGLAYAISQADPNAVIFAYSWVDESATGLIADTIPKDAYLSEAYTSLNGVRLANALQQILPTNFATSGGLLHLIGHSHGSKVATVATDVLTATSNTNFAVAQLTLLDSPEDASDLAYAVDATNNLWYFLGAINIGRMAGTTFVDNYISELDSSLGQIQGVDPFTGADKSQLQDIVDVNLNPSVVFKLPTDIGDRHGYAFNWYGGGSVAWAQNPTPDVANQWSPLIDPARTQNLAGSYDQTWTSSTDPQFTLSANGAEPSKNSVTSTATFSDMDYSSTTQTSGVQINGGSVTLTNNGTGTQTFTGKFDPFTLISGMSFNFQFSNMGAGDQLVISAGTGFAHKQQTHYVMTGTVAGTGPMFGTLSLGSLALSVFDNRIQIQLVTVAGSAASVTVNNMQQFKF
jgi:hypothetical protein